MGTVKAVCQSVCLCVWRCRSKRALLHHTRARNERTQEGTELFLFLPSLFEICGQVTKSLHTESQLRGGCKCATRPLAREESND